MNSKDVPKRGRDISLWAKQLPRHQPPPTLWQKIESRLQAEMRSLSAPVQKTPLRKRLTARLSHYVGISRVRWNWARAAAAMGTILLLVASFLHYQNKQGTEGFPTAINTDLEKTERHYRVAIERLTQQASQNEVMISPPLLALYEEKITLLDESIRQCQRALRINYYNPWARAALLQAYRQKVETLKLMLNRKEVS